MDYIISDQIVSYRIIEDTEEQGVTSHNAGAGTFSGSAPAPATLLIE